MNPNDVLAPYRLRAWIDKNGFLIIAWKDRTVGIYSGRILSPVVIPGLQVDVKARLFKLGEGEIIIDGQVLKFDGSESLIPME